MRWNLAVWKFLGSFSTYIHTVSRERDAEGEEQGGNEVGRTLVTLFHVFLYPACLNTCTDPIIFLRA